MKERWELAVGRIKEIENESLAAICEDFSIYDDYFKSVAAFICNVLDLVKENTTSVQRKAEINRCLYEDILPENYDKSYGNPEYAVEKLGLEKGRLLSFLYYQVRGIIPFLYELKRDERRETDIVILLEVFLEVYSYFVTCAQEGIGVQESQIHNILYYFVSDYADVTVRERVRDLVDSSLDFATDIIMNADLSNTSYLYDFGEYISANEIKTSEYIAGLSQEEIESMAYTYTNGYETGFIVTGKDLSKKETVNIRYILGFERVVRASIRNFEKMGLKPVIYRSPSHILNGSSTSRIGYYGAIPNRQYDYDHKEDLALFWDKALKERRLQILQEAFEENKLLANRHAGPAVMEVYGENPFAPKTKEACCSYNEKQQKLCVDFASSSGRITNEYIKGEERSFTIIAYPIPEIGEHFEEIFHETVKLNTLDYKKYQTMQQCIIDLMDQGIAACIKGKDGNETDLRVALRQLENPNKETQFENCVADVNIPVGEVFTSPVLKGTTGLLHVSEVYLNGLRFENLKLNFENGFITGYSCTNFDTESENKKYIKDNVLFNHETLPMGEFAIGTNTTAYAMAKKFKIFDRLPILIAEKTGPHFAVGDTCYSHAEEVAVYNPDGKEIVSRENECSLKRKENPSEAYFNCHTDVTIPYDELLELSVELKNGEHCPIISDGRFAVKGCEELNVPLVAING